MRKNLLLLFCLLLSQLAIAGIVTQSEARQKAMAFMAQRNAAAAQKGMRLAAKGSQLTPAATEASYYVFNVGQTEGFVVVSGDDRTPAILGYATDGTYSEADMPDNMRAWMAEYDRQLRFLATHPNAGIAKVQLDEHLAIAPLLTTTWNQGSPYNNKCPIDPTTSERSVTGCVATAMAQVINYHKYPEKTTATIPAYVSNENISVSAIAPTTIDWANMLDKYTGNETTAQKNAVATLMQLCGASVQMDYSSKSSGAQSQMVAIAMKKYFDFDATVYCAERDLYRANAWNNMIYNELANKRPVCYGGMSMGGGHEFVIDGYDREGLFHVNWGWGGTCDNYFLLSILDPNNNSGTGASTSTDGYSFGQDAIINAMPNQGNTIEEDPQRLTTSAISTTTTTFNYDSQDQGYWVEFNAQVWNQSGVSGTFDMAMAAIDAEENMASAYYILQEVQLDNGWGWKSFDCTGLLKLPDGEYTIVLISKLNSETYWHYNVGSEKYQLKATVSNNVLTLSGGTVDLSATSITATGNLEAGGLVNVKATITNNSDAVFNDVLYLQVDGEDISAKYFEAEPGQSDVFEIVYKPTTSGTKTFSIGYKKGDEFVSIVSKNIAIAVARSYSLAFSNGTITNATGSTINADKAQIQVTVRNTGSYSYNDCIKTYAFKKNSSGTSWSYFGELDTPVYVSTGATKTVNIEFINLTDGRYWFILVYKSNGEYISYNDNARYDDLYDYTVAVPEPIQTSGDGTKQNPYSVTELAQLMEQIEAGSTTDTPVYVKGKISEIIRKYTSVEGTATFDMTDDGTTAAGNKFRANSVFFLENGWWDNSHTQIKTGDETIVCATVVKADIPTSVAHEGYIYSLNGNITEGTPTVITSLPTDKQQPSVIYNMRGQKVSNPKKGVYIVRSAEGRLQGKKAVIR